MNEFLAGLQSSALGMAIRGETGWEYLFPNLETLHVISLTVVFGSILMVDLRLLGITERSRTVTKLAAEVLPYTWIAFACAAATGSFMFISKASTYIHNLDFQLKFLCMFLAGINMFVFHFGAYRHVQDWDAQLPTPVAAKVSGAISLLLWTGVIFFGRWIGFTT
jgi:hypothetical protein